MYHFFIYSSVDGHLGGFHFLAFIDCAAVNIGIYVPFFFSHRLKFIQHNYFTLHNKAQMQPHLKCYKVTKLKTENL